MSSELYKKEGEFGVRLCAAITVPVESAASEYIRKRAELAVGERGAARGDMDSGLGERGEPARQPAPQRALMVISQGW